MRSSLRHILSQPFVVATGFAALVHSTWSLATLFAGHEPEQFTGAWLAWVTPALLIALSLDLGQVVTAAEIRSGQRSRIKLATFGVFAVFTYGLQWYHLAHHAPLLLLADGVRKEWLPFAQFISDAMLWFVPALLPLSTLLYTFSSVSHEPEQASPPASEARQVTSPMQQVNVNILQPANEMPAISIEAKSASLPAGKATCPHCGWENTYETTRGAANGLNAHLRHCEAYLRSKEQVSKLEVIE